MKNIFFVIISITFLFWTCKPEKEPEHWISLFNGTDLTGWDIKISGHPLNENFNNTFLVKDSTIYVNYAQYDTFTHEFGHLFYHIPYSKYKLKMEYRLFGSPTPGSPVWAFQNSGVMLHAQSASSMELDQNFPISIEFQFLSRVDTARRATGNLASPGTHVVVDGKLHTNHMLYSSAKTYGDEWVKIEAVVLADSVVYHIVEGDTVLTYTKPQIGGWEKDEETGWVTDKSFVKKMLGTPLKEGYIALQAEGNPVQFRNIELLDLSEKKKE